MSFRRKAPPAPGSDSAKSAHGPRAAPTLCFLQVNAAATGIGTASYNCFIFNGCYIATRKPLIFRDFSL
jgi:hypothetical protein